MIFTTAKHDLGVYHDKNHQLVECCGGHVVFSYARKGNGMTAHIASDKYGLRRVKEAINQFCDWLFRVYEWCEMIFAVTSKASVKRLAERCGFELVAKDKSNDIYVRYRYGRIS